MAFKDINKLKSLLRCPETLRRIYWFGTRGYSFGGKRKIIAENDAFIFFSKDLPSDYDKPIYESSNPYQQKSLELIDEYPNGLVVDLGAGNPKHSFPNVCQIEIRKYPNTDIVITEGRIPLKSHSVDAVISEAVLEHVKNPFLHVSEIYRILKPRGQVLLDAAFIQPLHGYPSHYFNTTAYAVRLLFEKFHINSLHVGPHQHPWLALHWILNSYYSGLRSDHDRKRFKMMTIDDVMSTLNNHQAFRTEIKKSEDPWFVAQHLKDFNDDYAASLGLFLNISDSCREELAAGFQVYAQKRE